MEIIVSSIEELKEKAISLKTPDYLKLDIKKETLKFKIVIQKASCKIIGNMTMELDDIYEVYVEDVERINPLIKVPKELLDYYLNLLSKAENKRIAFIITLLMDKQLKIGDTILLNNKRKGVIITPQLNHLQICYKLLKKNGEVGLKEFTLYGLTDNYNYKCLDREFIKCDF